MFLLQLKSSRNIDYRFGAKFLENFKGLFPILGIKDYQLESIPHHGTLIDLLKQLAPEELDMLRIEMVKRLLRQRVLENYRLMDQYYLLAVDGTQMVTISEQEYEKNTDKYKHFLRRKISEDKDVEKQDCELKAFYRLAKKLKGYVPRTNFCLLFDSLYAGRPTFDLIEKNSWKYLIRFKEGSIPSVYQEFQRLLDYNKENKGRHIIDSKTEQQFRWVNDIEYAGHKLHILECQETVSQKGGLPKTTRFIWICSLRITPNNYKKLSNKGGRCRWIVENQGFNTQKNGGYELKHAYSTNHNAIKCFYIFLQISHIIIQLMVKGNLLKNVAKTFGSIQNFIDEFRIIFTRQYIDTATVLNALTQSFQIRLDSS